MSDIPFPAPTETITSGQTVSGAFYGSQDHIVVEGCLSAATLLQNGGGVGSIAVQSGGVLSGITVVQGGNIIVLHGGSASDLTVDGSRSADIVVEDGRYVKTVTASHSAGLDVRGGILSNVTLTTGADMTVASGAIVTGVSVNSTTDVAVNPNAQLSFMIVSNGGQAANTGGVVTSALIENGGIFSVERGYWYNSATGQGEYVSGTTDYCVISSGGTLAVGNGGVATHVGLQNGGRIDFSELQYDASARTVTIPPAIP